MQGSINSRKWAYLAGLIDGDGTIIVGRQKRKNGFNYHPWVCICSTDLKVIKWVVEVFGGQYYKLRTVKEHHKTPYQWMAQGTEHITAILNGVLPYLIMKRDRTENVLNYLSIGALRSQEEREYYFKLSKELASFYAPLVRTESAANISPTKDQYAYMAGLFDAEGSVEITKSTKRAVLYQLGVRLSNCDGRIISWLVNTFGGTMGISYPRNRRPAGTWRVPTANLEGFLLATLPYLIIKRERANLALIWRRAGKCEMGMKHIMFEKMRVLNKLGKSLTTNTSNCPENGQKIEPALIGDYERAPVVTQAA